MTAMEDKIAEIDNGVLTDRQLKIHQVSETSKISVERIHGILNEHFGS